MAEWDVVHARSTHTNSLFFAENLVNAERREKKIEMKNCAHIIFPEKTTDETESKAERIKLISHFWCWSSQHSRRSVWMRMEHFETRLFCCRIAKLVFPIRKSVYFLRAAGVCCDLVAGCMLSL